MIVCSLIDPAVIWNAISGAVSKATSSLSKIQADFKVNLNALQMDLQVNLDSIDVTPKDYNPPVYPSSSGNITEDVRDQHSSSSVSICKFSTVSILFI